MQYMFSGDNFNVSGINTNGYQANLHFTLRHNCQQTTQQNSNTEHCWLFNCQNVSRGNYVNESVFLQ